MLAQRMAEPGAGQLPRPAAGRRAGSASATPRAGVVDARRAGQQRLVVDPPGPASAILGPGDPPQGSCRSTTQSRARRTVGHSSCTNALSRRTSQWCQTPTARYADKLVSPLASSTSPPTIFIGHEPSAALRARPPSGRPAPPRRPGRRRPAPSRDSTWFQTSVCCPGVHGIAPQGSCIATIDAAVAATSPAASARVSSPRAAHARACGSTSPSTCRSPGRAGARRTASCGASS